MIEGSGELLPTFIISNAKHEDIAIIVADFHNESLIRGLGG